MRPIDPLALARSVHHSKERLQAESVSTRAPAEPGLPLSWSQSRQITAPHFQTVNLWPARSQWLAFADLPAGGSLSQTVSEIQAHFRQQNLVIRGCHPRFIAAMNTRYASGEILLTGREALLDLSLPHLHKRSLKELARRGRRHGQILLLEQHDRPDIQAVLERVRAGYTTPLSYLYRTHLPDSERFWVLQGERQIWGLISAIPTGNGCWHTELLIRDPEAPVGVMEALVWHVFHELQAAGERYWSLGEVPFASPVPPQGLKAQLIQQVGQGIDFAYSAQGLYQFKQKFRPLWRPVYLGGWPHLSWLSLSSMFWRSRCSQMVLGSIWKDLIAVRLLR